MKHIALKIDVDTCRGTLTGVPALIDLLLKHQAQASFFFSLGPDHGGREIHATSLNRYYDLRTRLYGRLLPSPDIGKRCIEIMRQAQAAGFEAGIHAWDRVRWERSIEHAGNPWVESEMDKACTRFSDTFAEPAKAHAAAGWQTNRHALRLTQRLGFSYASDCRGDHPFIPVIDGEIVACPQLPTTLPTLDEILVMEPGFSPDQAVDRILQLSAAIPGDHLFTLRAELEGMPFIGAFERLLSRWEENGYRLGALRDIYATLDLATLPRHVVRFAETPGRAGLRMMQGPGFLQD